MMSQPCYRNTDRTPLPGPGLGRGGSQLGPRPPDLGAILRRNGGNDDPLGNGTIGLTSTLDITGDMTPDGTGQQVTLGGCQAGCRLGRGLAALARRSAHRS